MEEKKNIGILRIIQPEDKLHDFTPEKMKEVNNAFFSTPQEKPLVIFYDNLADYLNPIYSIIEKQAEQAFGLGAINDLEIKQGEELLFESKIKALSEMPYFVFRIICHCDRDYALRLALLLSRQSGKHVVILLHGTNAIEDYERSIRYRDGAAQCFATWKEKAYFAVADCNEGLYRKKKQLFLAYHDVGIIDFVRGKHIGRTEEMEKMGRMLADINELKSGYMKFVTKWSSETDIPGAKFYQLLWLDDEIKIDKSNRKRWVLSLDIEPYRIDRDLLKKIDKKEPKLTVWVDMDGSEVVDYERNENGFIDFLDGINE